MAGGRELFVEMIIVVMMACKSTFQVCYIHFPFHLLISFLRLFHPFLFINRFFILGLFFLIR